MSPLCPQASTVVPVEPVDVVVADGSVPVQPPVTYYGADVMANQVGEYWLGVWIPVVVQARNG